MPDRTCSVDGCERKHLAHGYCSPHMRRWQANGDPGPAAIQVKQRHLTTVCAVDGCDRTRSRREWCVGHYGRMYVHGSVGDAFIPDRSKPRLCSIDDCGRPHDGHGFCSLHNRRQQKHGDPLAEPIRHAVGDPRGWRRRTVGYMGAHNRTRRLRGKARDYRCLSCVGRARDWAYDHQDPAEMYEIVKGYNLPYSQDPWHYIPLCKSCHVVMDRQFQP